MRVAVNLVRGICAAQKGVVDTQLIAHDREVYDIAWGGVGVFASVSADGSVRVFDLRCGKRLACGRSHATSISLPGAHSAYQV